MFCQEAEWEVPAGDAKPEEESEDEHLSARPPGFPPA